MTGLYAQSIQFYIAAPGSETSAYQSVVGASTENFNSLPTGNDTTAYSSSIGTFQFSPTTPLNVSTADQFGGAAGTGKYIALGSQSGTTAPVTINLTTAANYLGFWWSAGDANNGISFYDGNTLLYRFSASQITSFLTPTSGTTTAANGTVYNNSSYYGNPNAAFLGQNSSEAYAYIDIVTTGVTFDKIVLDNSGTTGTGFESDNYTVYNGTVTLPGDSLITSVAVVPEPWRAVNLTIILVLFLVAMQRLIRQMPQRINF